MPQSKTNSLSHEFGEQLRDLQIEMRNGEVQQETLNAAERHLQTLDCKESIKTYLFIQSHLFGYDEVNTINPNLSWLSRFFHIKSSTLPHTKKAKRLIKQTPLLA